MAPQGRMSGRACRGSPCAGHIGRPAPHQTAVGAADCFSLRAKSRLRRLRSDTRLRAQPLGGSRSMEKSAKTLLTGTCFCGKLIVVKKAATGSRPSAHLAGFVKTPGHTMIRTRCATSYVRRLLSNGSRFCLYHTLVGGVLQSPATANPTNWKSMSRSATRKSV